MAGKPTAIIDIAGLTDALNTKFEAANLSHVTDGTSVTTPVSELAISTLKSELTTLHSTESVTQAQVIGLSARLTSIEQELELLRNAVFPSGT